MSSLQVGLSLKDLDRNSPASSIEDKASFLPSKYSILHGADLVLHRIVGFK